MVRGIFNTPTGLSVDGTYQERRRKNIQESFQYDDRSQDLGSYVLIRGIRLRAESRLFILNVSRLLGRRVRYRPRQ